jgi:hypothetical protein
MSKERKPWLALQVAAKSKGKDMIVELHFIMGFMLGFEYVNIPEDDATHLVLDFGIARLMISFIKDGVDFN